MITRRTALLGPLAASLALAPLLARAAAPGFTFPSIDGGTIDLAALRGRPVLVVNTASQCVFTEQYDALQTLHEEFEGRATVLAVPSDDFGGQELENAAAVKEFCAVNFDLTLPMTDIQVVRGPNAHPFYLWAAGQGVVPRWNFHKILLGRDGSLIADFASQVTPDSARLRRALAAAL